MEFIAFAGKDEELILRVEREEDAERQKRIYTGVSRIQSLYKNALSAHMLSLETLPHDLSPDHQLEICAGIAQNQEWKSVALRMISASFGCDAPPDVFTRGHDDAPDLGITMPIWNEEGWGCYKPCVDGANVSVKIMPFHSYAVMYERRWFPHIKTERRAMVVAGCMTTEDDKLVLGVRAGEYDTGRLAVLPAGFVSNADIEIALHNESIEEVGIDKEHLSKTPRLMGVFMHTDGRYVFCYDVELNITFYELKKLWIEARDKWEHAALFAVPWDRVHSMKDILNAFVSRTNKSIESSPISDGVLAMAMAHRYGGKPEYFLRS